MDSKTVDTIYTYLWHRKAENLGLLKFARWKSIIKYKEPKLNDNEIRKVFQKLVENGHFIQCRKGKRTHFDYLFSQKPLFNMIDKEEYIKEMTKADPCVSFE